MSPIRRVSICCLIFVNPTIDAPFTKVMCHLSYLFCEWNNRVNMWHNRFEYNLMWLKTVFRFFSSSNAILADMGPFDNRVSIRKHMNISPEFSDDIFL